MSLSNSISTKTFQDDWFYESSECLHVSRTVEYEIGRVEYDLPTEQEWIDILDSIRRDPPEAR